MSLRETVIFVFTAIIALVVAVMYFCTYGTMVFSELEQANDELYRQQGGKEYSYINDYVKATLDNIETARQEKDIAQEKYELQSLTFMKNAWIRVSVIEWIFIIIAAKTLINNVVYIVSYIVADAYKIMKLLH